MPIHSAETRKRTPASPRAEWLFAGLPKWVVDSLTSKQKEALDSVAAARAWTRSPVNIRFSVPSWRRRYYVTIVSGEEKRGRDRLAKERTIYPLRTAANAFFFVGLVVVIYAVALVALGVVAAIIEI